MAALRSTGRRGGILMGVLMTGLVLVVVAIVIGISVARNVKVETTGTHDGDNVSIKTPAGDFTIRAHEKDARPWAGLPVYPGARETKDSGGAEFHWTSADGSKDKEFSVAGGAMVTSDSVDKVADYYRSKLPSWVVTHEHGEIKFEESPGARGTEPRRFVAISAESDGTHIGVATVGAPPAN